jgi:hypothetical protein
MIRTNNTVLLLRIKLDFSLYVTSMIAYYEQNKGNGFSVNNNACVCCSK